LTLEAGTRLGSYEIVSLLGAGGMGVVYRAPDTRLGREVAVKVLPAEVAGDGERLARFEREARLLASLNHPHIATLHGYERASETSFLVMELVEGETLADRIARGPIPVEEAMPIALQIADGLEAAHEKGVVHRDQTGQRQAPPRRRRERSGAAGSLRARGAASCRRRCRVQCFVSDASLGELALEPCSSV
jgi:hypothetical protein